MIFYQITFGLYNKKTYEAAKELIEDYLSMLKSRGQIDKHYNIVPWQGQVVAYVSALGLTADRQKSHCESGKERLKKVLEFFGQMPVWTCNEDFPTKKNATWKNAPFLSFFAHSFDYESPVCRGDNGLVIPYFTLPIADMERESIYRWANQYRDFYDVWLNSGELEIQSYRLLAEPDSSLSVEGRECSAVIEKTTGVPTYYYLMRYYGREEAEEKARRCPGCGKPWFVKRPEKQIDEHKPFWDFDFMCKRCRLVSHCACRHSLYPQPRYAKIGEPRKKTQSPKRER